MHGASSAVLISKILAVKIIALFLSPSVLFSLPSAQCRTESKHLEVSIGGKFSFTLGTRGGGFFWIAILVYFPTLEWKALPGGKSLKAIISPEVGIYDAERFVTLFKGQALRAMRTVGEHKP